METLSVPPPTNSCSIPCRKIDLYTNHYLHRLTAAIVVPRDNAVQSSNFDHNTWCPSIWDVRNGGSSTMRIDTLQVYLLVVWLTSSVLARCPRDLVTSVFSCLHHIQPTRGKTGALIGGDAWQFEQQCHNGSFGTVMRCLENIFVKCQRSERREDLRDIVDLSTMRRTIDKLCRNIHIYKRYNTCIGHTERERRTCAKGVQERRQSHAHPSDSVRQKLRKVCRFMNEVAECSERPIRHRCGAVPADFVQSFMLGLTPPYCRSYQNSQRSAAISNTFSLSNYRALFFILALFYTGHL